jgi:hypothetical protein
MGEVVHMLVETLTKSDVGEGVREVVHRLVK